MAFQTMKVRCYVCGEKVDKDRTALRRHRVRSGAIHTPHTYTYRIVRKCIPWCQATPVAPAAGQHRATVVAHDVPSAHR